MGIAYVIIGVLLGILVWWLLTKNAKHLTDQEKAKYQAILSSIGEGTVVLDIDGCVEWMNARGERMMGWTLGEIAGRNWHEVVPLQNEEKQFVPPERRATRRVLETGEVITSDKNYYIRKDGSRFPVGTTAGPVVLDGKTIGVVAVFRDMTREREIDRAKSEFVSLASHQLRTPLSAIKWFAEMLLAGDAGKLSKEQHEYVENISLSNERMIDLVNSLLNISRIESGRIIINPEPTDLKKLVEGVVSDLRGKLEEKKQKLAISVHKGMPKINLDPKLISQVYSNLLTNAIKYSPAQSQIMVVISRKDHEVVSQISDNGYGIPKSEQARMFEKFYRGSNITTLETEGTGLGLYLAKAVVESSGGKIWYVSEEGKGTTFWFSLPLSGMVAKMGEVSLA